jgi:hypothetical protein
MNIEPRIGQIASDQGAGIHWARCATSRTTTASRIAIRAAK